MEKISLSGRSSNGRITFISNAFASTASCKIDAEGKPTFECHVEELGDAPVWLSRMLSLPPLILWYILGVVFGSSLAFLLTTMAVVSHLFLPKSELEPAMAYALLVSLPLLHLLFFRRKNATWHAAEHMAVNCVEKRGVCDAFLIENESAVHKKCGGRFFLPMYLTLCTAVILHLELEYSFWWCLVGVEIILWLDRLIGLEKIPVISHMSEWIQRTATTRPPGPNEIGTAVLAMEKLIQSHQEIGDLRFRAV